MCRQVNHLRQLCLILPGPRFVAPDRGRQRIARATEIIGQQIRSTCAGWQCSSSIGEDWSDAQPLDFCCVRRIRGLAQMVLAYQDAGVWYAGGRLMPWCYREDLAKPVQEPNTWMLAQKRRCFCLHAGLTPKEAELSTLHSCKATSLNWAQHLGLPLDLAAAQGHHRLPKWCGNEIWAWWCLAATQLFVVSALCLLLRCVGTAADIAGTLFCPTRPTCEYLWWV